jgi:hypothetical protein
MSNEFQEKNIKKVKENEMNRKILEENSKNFSKIYHSLKYNKIKNKNKTINNEREKRDFLSMINFPYPEKNITPQSKNSFSNERKIKSKSPNVLIKLVNSKKINKKESKSLNSKTSILDLDFNFEFNQKIKESYIKDDNKNIISTIEKIDSLNNISNIKNSFEGNFQKKNNDKESNIYIKKITSNNSVKPLNENKNKDNNIFIQIKNKNSPLIEKNNKKEENDDFLKRTKDNEILKYNHLEKMKVKNLKNEISNLKFMISNEKQYLKINKKNVYQNNRIRDIESGKNRLMKLYENLERYENENNNNSSNLIKQKKSSSSRNERINEFKKNELEWEKKKLKNLEKRKQNKTANTTLDEISKIKINKISKLINEGKYYNHLSQSCQKLNEEYYIRKTLKPILNKYFPIINKPKLKKSSSQILNQKTIIKGNKEKYILKPKLNNQINNNNNNYHKKTIENNSEEKNHWTQKLKNINKGKNNKNLEELYKINIREDGAWNINTMNEILYTPFNRKFVNSIIKEHNLLEDKKKNN